MLLHSERDQCSLYSRQNILDVEDDWIFSGFRSAELLAYGQEHNICTLTEKSSREQCVKSRKCECIYVWTDDFCETDLCYDWLSPITLSIPGHFWKWGFRKSYFQYQIMYGEISFSPPKNPIYNTLQAFTFTQGHRIKLKTASKSIVL